LVYCEQEPICLVSLQAGLLGHSLPIIYFSWENIQRRDPRYRLFSLVRAFCYRRSLFMTAGTKDAAAVMRRQGCTKPIYITPILGVSEELFSPQTAEPRRPGAAKKPFAIGYIGRLSAQKGVDTLIRAAASLTPVVDWHLLLLGGGPDKPELVNLLQHLKISDRVTFQPPVSHDEVPAFLHGLDVLVLPSRTTPTWKEQFGHVLIEAMACKVPVVGSSSGEIPRVIGGAGLIFQENDPADLREKLVRLANDVQLCQDLQQRGMERVKERYTDARIAANMISLYEIALNLERRTPNTLELYSG
jgi:glycosyltransferase involved in cell wall biosynthesis